MEALGFRIRLANHAKVKFLGLIKNLEVDVFISVRVLVNFHVMPAGLGAFPLILGRPWLRVVGVVQDWGKGVITVYSKKGEKVFDMTTKQPLVLEDMSEDDESGVTSEESSEDSESSLTSSSSDEGEVSFLLLDEEKKVDCEVLQVSAEDINASSRLEQLEELMQPKQGLAVKRELIQNMLCAD